MTRVTITTVSALASASAVAWLAAGAFTPATAQSAAPSASEAKPAGPAPKMADGHPDLSGVWWGGGDVGGRGFRPGGGPPAGGGPPPATFTSLYKPQAAEHAKTLSDKDDPTLHCNPVAFGTLNVRLWNVGAVGQIVATPKLVVLLSETFHDYQLVPTDGRKHREDQPPTLRGDAVGHWEGDTFVVDVNNFTDDTWMWAEGRVSFHSDALHIVERYRRVDANTLEIEATVEDPKVLTAPWHVPKQTLKLAPFDTLLSLNCATDETDKQIQSASQPKK
ncbi:MAG TPA: hypothetical protein VMV37_10775 [Gammaproteobacteria bacterium]|nr:hypothetical protein [Gammaproteobacteria bacterium]